MFARAPRGRRPRSIEHEPGATLRRPGRPGLSRHAEHDLAVRAGTARAASDARASRGLGALLRQPLSADVPRVARSGRLPPPLVRGRSGAIRPDPPSVPRPAAARPDRPPAQAPLARPRPGNAIAT